VVKNRLSALTEIERWGRRRDEFVCFNAGFDLSRLGVDWETAENGGWSLILSQWRNSITGKLQPNKFSPRIVIKALNSKTSIMLGPNGDKNGSFGLSPDSYLFNLEHDSTEGKNYPNPSILMGVFGTLVPTDDSGNLYVNSTVVQDNSSFNVGNLGALGGSAFWNGSSGKLLDFEYGVIGASYSVGPGNVGESWGVRGLATIGYVEGGLTGTGTVNHNKGGTFGSGGNSGTITHDYTLFVEKPLTGAAFTNPHEGLHIEGQTVGGVLPDAYAINIQGGKNDLGPGVTMIGTHTPLSASDPCDTGTITWDANFIYVCVATNTWKRTAVSTW
jgi:hypothetical protein